MILNFDILSVVDPKMTPDEHRTKYSVISLLRLPCTY